MPSAAGSRQKASPPTFLVEHYRIGPPMESDWTRWETELAYLILDA
jgi:hypothetical protein